MLKPLYTIFVFNESVVQAPSGLTGDVYTKYFVAGKRSRRG